MKLLTWVLPALLTGSLLSSTLEAQTKFALGLRTGLNFSTISFDPNPFANDQTVSKGGRTGFLVGAATEVEFAKMFAVELDLLYMTQGATFTRSTDQATDAIKLAGLEIPIVFKVKFLSGAFHPYVFAGPSFGFLMSATEVVDVPASQFQQAFHRETDLKSHPDGVEISSMDMSLTFGAGGEFLVTKQFGVFMDARYALGLTNIASYGSQVQIVQGVQQPSWKTSGFMIQIGGMVHL